VDDENMALDVIRETAPTGDFMTTAHTLAHYREVLSRPMLAVRTRREAWESAGGRTYSQAVQERLSEILTAEPESCLDAHQWPN
jgi:trimethylamine:corrinoid methyltransferase-like protein